jgi:hypothetical protein
VFESMGELDVVKRLGEELARRRRCTPGGAR